MEAPVSDGTLGEVVARVESELAAFWAAPDESLGRSVAKVRAATMTLVVATASEHVDGLRTQVRELAASHPSRALIFTVDGRIPGWDVRTDVDAVCELGGPVALCHDRVEIALGALAAGRAGSIVRALALPEVPRVVELGPGAPRSLADALVASADRLILDSDALPAARLAELARATAAPIADRGWVRSFTWRELVARAFDGAAPAARAVTRVEVRRTPSPRAEPAAMLFGWLASRLGWRFEGRRRARDAAGRSVELVVGDDARADVAPGALTAVALDTVVDGRRLSLRVERADDPSSVRWSTTGARVEAHEHRLGFRDEAWVLAKAIDPGAQDRVVRDALLAGAAWSAS
jgi:glucose-6-phosphate dehydrogenase assembly protein OpcA